MSPTRWKQKRNEMHGSAEGFETLSFPVRDSHTFYIRTDPFRGAKSAATCQGSLPTWNSTLGQTAFDYHNQ
ncbi:hypothetical protein PGT21_006838 [Puccinia graminis f. sp. tritici]|uniref:Uncharacterized protein n=1 Tax=Puccinia graminis f. sp. tritici TaxID=56615 RepID=A0A5B0Q581_PUCGR|nr:hypothetical protein PGT21_006838 [Puccinia graminis f. sp. tritici]